MPWDKDEHWMRNWRFVIIMIYVTVVAIGCAYGIKKASDANTELRHQAVTFANRQCMTSNQARQVVYDLLNRAEAQIRKTPTSSTVTEAQKDAAIKFYEDAKDHIHFSDCPPPLP